LKAHVEMLDRERKDHGPDYRDHGVPRDRPCTATPRRAAMRRSTGRHSASGSGTRTWHSP
jgi:hypothetical protein